METLPFLFIICLVGKLAQESVLIQDSSENHLQSSISIFTLSLTLTELLVIHSDQAMLQMSSRSISPTPICRVEALEEM